MGACVSEADARNRITAALAAHGAPDFELFRHETRWVALTPTLMVLAADDATDWSRLEAEAAVLAELAGNGFPAPAVIHADAALGVQLRERIAGACTLPDEPQRRRDQ